MSYDFTLISSAVHTFFRRIELKHRAYMSMHEAMDPMGSYILDVCVRSMDAQKKRCRLHAMNAAVMQKRVMRSKSCVLEASQ